MAVSKFGNSNCTGTRFFSPINSTNEQKADKITMEVKQAAPTENTAVPSAPTPDPVVEAVTPPPQFTGAVPAVPAGTAAETTAGY